MNLDLPAHVIAGLIASAVNHLLSEDDSCCPQHCAECASLAWLAENASRTTEQILKRGGQTGYTWCPNGLIDWQMITSRWECGPLCGTHPYRTPTIRLAYTSTELGTLT